MLAHFCSVSCPAVFPFVVALCLRTNGFSSVRSACWRVVLSFSVFPCVRFVSICCCCCCFAYCIDVCRCLLCTNNGFLNLLTLLLSNVSIKKKKLLLCFSWPPVSPPFCRCPWCTRTVSYLRSVLHTPAVTVSYLCSMFLIPVFLFPFSAAVGWWFRCRTCRRSANTHWALRRKT